MLSPYRYTLVEVDVGEGVTPYGMVMGYAVFHTQDASSVHLVGLADMVISTSKRFSVVLDCWILYGGQVGKYAQYVVELLE